MKKEYYTFNEYIKNNMLSPSEEDYIEMIYRLENNNDLVKVVKLATALNVKTPSASRMVKKLSEKGLLNHEKYGVIKLTEIGEVLGRKLLERHNIVERFLTIIGVECQLHNETEKIEHTVSDETLHKIKLLVQFLEVNKNILNEFEKYKF